EDSGRTDTTFLPMFQMKYRRYTNPKKFVFPQNPMRLNERLSIQQGVFLCPADVSTTFNDNIKAMTGWDDPGNIVKLTIELDRTETEHFAAMLKQMNLSSAALFPGLDGFARSIAEHVLHYRALAAQRDRIY